MNLFPIGFGLGAACVSLIVWTFGEHTLIYKQGQIDALSGNLKYHLVQQSDGTVKWERIDDK